jgi:DNA-binding transcriptional LysR family regulator
VQIKRGHLRYFVAVADEGQLACAAARLHVAQPALAQAIARLESDLGLELFERRGGSTRLTPDGEKFLAKARPAVEAEQDAVHTAQALVRADIGELEFGFVGAPPGLDTPGPLARFGRDHPDVSLRYRELPFPGMSSSRWLSEVDIAVCHVPPRHENVWTEAVRSEARAVIFPRNHRLADRDHVTVSEVIDEMFIGYHPSVDPDWAGFWSLDGHRGGPPARVTADQVSSPQEVFAALAAREAITTVPSSSAAILVEHIADISAVLIPDAQPARFVLAGRQDRRSAQVESFVAFAREDIRRAARARDVA